VTVDAGVLAEVRQRYGAEIDRVTQIEEKKAMESGTKALRNEILEALGGAEPRPSASCRSAAPSTRSRKRPSGSASP